MESFIARFAIDPALELTYLTTIALHDASLLNRVKPTDDGLHMLAEPSDARRKNVGAQMKCARFLAILAAVVLFLPAMMIAKDKEEGSVQLTTPIQLGNTRLQPGEYEVEWIPSNSGIKVKFLQQDKTLATVHGEVVELKHPSPYDAVVLKPARSGQGNTIDEIEFDNRSEALRIEPRIKPSGVTP